MSEIKLISHAVPPNPHNTSTITYGKGKPQTVVSGDCWGFRMRRDDEPVHLRTDEDGETCAVCGQWAMPWYEARDRWQSHPSRCQS
jgi:hypothetical protein